MRWLWLLLLLALPTDALGFGMQFVASRSTCAVNWHQFPSNQVPHATKAIIAAVPAEAVTLRMPNSSGGWAQTRRMLGEANTMGAVTGPARRTGTWASMRNTFNAGNDSGIALLENQGVEFLVENLTKDFNWEIQCQDSAGMWAPATRGTGTAHLIPADGAVTDTRVFLASDDHFFRAWEVCIAAGPWVDANSNGFTDGCDSWYRNILAYELILERINKFKPDLFINLGDNYLWHGGSATGCTVEDDGFCTAATNSILENYTGQTRSMLYASGGVIGQWGNTAGYYGDAVEFSEARAAFWRNAMWESLHQVPVLLARGNHEAPPYHEGIGLSDHINLISGADTPDQSANINRQAERNYVTNPNDAKLYATGATGEADNNEEQGFYWAVPTGQLLLVTLDPYINSTGTESAATEYIFGDGNTFTDTDCEGDKEPLATCSGAGTGTSATMPSTPFEWQLGSAQETWFSNLMSTTTAKVVVVMTHGTLGGYAGTTNSYHYARGHARERWCIDTSDGVTRSVTTASTPADILDTGTGAMAVGADIPCWDGAGTDTGTDGVAPLTVQWCDYVDDGDTSNNTSECSEGFDHTRDIFGREQWILTQMSSYMTRTGGIAIRTWAHDHLSFFYKGRFDSANDGWFLNTGRIGAFFYTNNNATTDWADSWLFENAYDFDGNGVPDYREAQYILDDANKNYTQLNSQVSPSNLRGWDGRGFLDLVVRGVTGCVELKFVVATNQTDEDGSLNGSTGWESTVCP